MDIHTCTRIIAQRLPQFGNRLPDDSLSNKDIGPDIVQDLFFGYCLSGVFGQKDEQMHQPGLEVKGPSELSIERRCASTDQCPMRKI